jgi:hypothetical protein
MNDFIYFEQYKLYEFGMTAIFEIILPVCDLITDRLKYIKNEKR